MFSFALLAIVVSDQEATSWHNANEGATLPRGVDATYNIALSPTFISRSGVFSTQTIASVTRGDMGRLFAGSVTNSGSMYYLVDYTNNIQPSARDTRATGYPLRCLVSTTNS